MTPRAPTLHQLVAGFATGDAISQAALALRDLARELGAEAEIFAPPDRVAPDARHQVRPLDAFDGADCTIHHYSIASPVELAFQRAGGRKVLYYHNITPAEFFDPYDAAIARQLRAARAALPEELRRVDAVWAVSAFNAAELRAAGARDVRVFPLIFDPARLAVPPSALAAAALVPRDMTNILFVGRLAPNKRVEDLILAFAWYHLRLNRRSRLVLIGSDHTAPPYFTMLRLLARELDLSNVLFQRFAPQELLGAWYDAASLFVCASRHEGYCLPLIEAMSRGVPVVARDVGGMPEALDGAGVLYDDLAPAELACLWHRLQTDAALRESVLASQRTRLEAIRRRPLREEFVALVNAAAPGLLASGV